MSEGTASAAPPSLAAFLAARLDEDEAGASEIHNGTDCRSCGPLQLSCDCGYPARVLREVAAKRAVLAEWEEANGHRWDLPDGVAEGRDDSERERDDGMAALLDGIVAILGAVYSDHPGYRDEWKP